MFPRFIRIVVCIRISSLLRLNNIQLDMYATSGLSINTGSLPDLATVNNAAMDTDAQIICASP